MGKGREREELSLNSPDCELVYCLLSYTASKKREDEGHAGWGPLGQCEDNLDLLTVSASWDISYLVLSRNRDSESPRGRPYSSRQIFFKALKFVSHKRCSELKTSHWCDLCFLFWDGYSSVQWAPWHSAKQRSRSLEDCGWSTTSSNIKKKVLNYVTLVFTSVHLDMMKQIMCRACSEQAWSV